MIMQTLNTPHPAVVYLMHQVPYQSRKTEGATAAGSSGMDAAGGSGVVVRSIVIAETVELEARGAATATGTAAGGIALPLCKRKEILHSV